MKGIKPVAALALCGLVLGAGWLYLRDKVAPYNVTRWRFAPDVSLPGGSSRATSVAFAPNGNTLAVATMVFPATYPQDLEDNGDRSRRCEVQLWDVPQRLRQASLVISDRDGPRGKAWPEMGFARDGKKLCYWGLGITMWDTQNAVQIAASKRFPRKTWAEYLNIPSPADIEFQNTDAKPLSHNGKYRVMPGANGTAELYTTAPQRLTYTFAVPHRLFDLVFTPDDRFLVGCDGSAVHFWNVSTGNEEATLQTSSTLRHPVFSLDGRWLAAIENDSTVFVCAPPVKLADSRTAASHSTAKPPT